MHSLGLRCWIIASLLSPVLVTMASAQNVTRTRLVASPSVSTYGAPVELTAEVDGLGGGAPSGTVEFFGGETKLGVASLQAAGARTTIAGGLDRTCALTSVAGVKCWGGYYDLVPTDVPGLARGVAAIAAGAGHRCALLIEGAVKCWGKNGSGQLGDGTNTNRSTPTDVVGLSSGVIAIATGFEHSCALMRDGAVKCWGLNLYGRLGDGSNVDRNTPVQVVGLTSDVTAVSLGDWHSCALTRGGAVKCWGLNNKGQVGDGTMIRRLTPTQVVGLESGGVAIALGYEHSCALIGAKVKCWGENIRGELGNGGFHEQPLPVPVVGLPAPVVALSAGGHHNCALETSGVIRCWGFNRHGQIGYGAYGNLRPTPAAVFGLTDVAAIGAGGFHTCAVKRDGSTYCWGDADAGQVGDGTNGDSYGTRRFPTAVSGHVGLGRARAQLMTSNIRTGVSLLKAYYSGDGAHRPSFGTASQRVK